MKKMLTIIICLIIIVIISVIGICIWMYNEEQENKRIDAEAVTLKENLTIEFGKEAKVSDFLEKLNGELINDYKIDTEKLGEIQVSFDFINIKNKKRTATFNIKTTDVTAPKIFSGASYTVKKGSNKNLTEVLISGDDIDDNPKREIVGEYDFNTVGDYKLTYVVTDSSGNQAKKDFTLHVIEEQTTPQPPPTEKEPIYFNDILDN